MSFRTMMVVILMVVVVTILSSQPANAANIFTAFSRGFEDQEEINSTVLHKGAGWVEVAVPGQVWACTDQRPPITATNQMAAFLRLFNYLNGRNDKDQHLPMGTPVSIEASKAVGEEEGKLSACFYLPRKIQSHPPTPSDSRVYLTQRPALTVYSRRFGGFASDEGTWRSEVERLKEVLTAQGKKIRTDVQYWNAYDPPHKFWSRRNEVWLVKV